MEEMHFHTEVWTLEKSDTVSRNFTDKNNGMKRGNSTKSIVKTQRLIEKNEREEGHGEPKKSLFGHLLGFFGWWFGFTNLYAMFSVCPFCGQQGCPVGMGITGILGAFSALCVQDWKWLPRSLKKVLRKAFTAKS